MKVYCINGTSFVGKSTVLRILQRKLPGRCAILDGDDVGRIFPCEFSLRWLDLIQDNISACAKPFDAAGADYFLFAFPFPNMERIERMSGLFKSHGYTVNWVNLVASDSTLEERFRSRGGTKPQNLQLGLEMNRGIMKLDGFFTVETTRLTPEQVAAVVTEHIQGETRQPVGVR